MNHQLLCNIVHKTGVSISTSPPLPSKHTVPIQTPTGVKMNPNNQSLKMTTKELAKQVFPLVKQFVTGKVSARRNRPQEQQQHQQPLIAAGRFINRLLYPQNLQNNYPPESADQQQPPMENYQGREHEIRECLRAHNAGTLLSQPL